MRRCVSLIIPVYNTAPWLRRCLDSVCGQTLTEIEIICINDGSTDESEAIINEYAQKDRRIVPIHLGRNLGVSVARNIGIAAASCEWIGFVDSDDALDTNFCEKLFSIANTDTMDVVKGVLWSERNAPNYVNHEFNQQIKLDKFNFLYEWYSAIYRTEFLKINNIHFLPGCTNYEDTAFLYNVVLCTDRIFTTEDAIYYYFFRDGSAYQKIMNYKMLKSAVMSLKNRIDLLNKYINDDRRYVKEYVRILQTCCSYSSRLLMADTESGYIHLQSAISEFMKNCRKYDLLVRTIKMRHNDLTFLINGMDQKDMTRCLALHGRQRRYFEHLKHVRQKNYDDTTIGNRQMHIGILLPEFVQKGGMERVSANLAEGLTERGHQCTLFFPSPASAELPYHPKEPVCLHPLPSPPITDAWLETVRRTLHEAHLDVLCFMSNGSPFGRFLPYICQDLSASFVWSEHCSPKVQQMLWNSRERHACMSLADGVHVLTSAAIDSLPNFIQEYTSVIPNFSSLPNMPNPPLHIHGVKKRLLVVARLSEEKQLPVLLHALAYLKDIFNDWECRICGDGPKRMEYEELIRSLDLQKHVLLLGAVENIAEEYSAADIFCLPSQYESFGLAVVEAQSFGIPSVGFAGCPGVNEIILDGENGLLAPEMTSESLAQALRSLMVDEEMRLRMRARALELFTRYDRGHLLDQWENLFIDAQAKSGRNILVKMEVSADPTLQTTLRALLDKPLQVAREDWRRVFGVARSLIKQGSPAQKKQ